MNHIKISFDSYSMLFDCTHSFFFCRRGENRKKKKKEQCGFLMEKEIYTRHLSREGTGCVWLFMNMFDLRHGGSNHKLLLDRKRGSKRITGLVIRHH